MLRLLLALGAVGVAAALVLFVFDDDGPSYPDEWDERVLDLVEFVEDERGHDFEHPVAVDFLDAEEYAELQRTEPDALSEEDREALAQAEGTLRALGLVEGDIDLLESTNDISDTGTLAFYTLEDDRIVVRGTEITPALEVTLAHELTHALQDQVFDLDDVVADLEDATSGRQFAYRSLVEGDAGRVQRAYEATLDDDERAEIDEAETEGLDDLESEDVPVALQALFSAPYALGDGFMEVIAADGDVDDAFEDMPSTEEQVLDPFAYLDDDEPVAVDTPDTDDAEATDEGDFGAASLLLVLAERIDIATAYDAVLGWGGDAYATFERDGRTCIRIDVVGDDTPDTDQLEAALSQWVSAAPAGSAGVGRDGDVVRFESCDPGEEAGGGTGAALDALSYAAARTQIAATTLAGGATEEQALCFADAVVDALTPEELAAPELTPEAQQRLNDAALACR